MAVDTNTLELIRKTVFGGTQGGVLDFNAAFNPAHAAASVSFNTMMSALMPSDPVRGGGDPGTNASGNENGMSPEARTRSSSA